MKFVAISDTHGQHHQLNLPKGDVLIHSGDVTSRGQPREVEDFLEWFENLDFQYKIFIAGNHDFFFEKADDKRIQEMIPSNVIYLNDSGVDIEGVKVWGSPVTPWFHDWAFNRDRGEGIKKHWDLIPEDTSILITHGPPFGLLDETVYREKVGCLDLAVKVKQVQPAYHIFGHIHEGYGQASLEQVNSINASVLDERYRLVNPPIEFSH